VHEAAIKFKLKNGITGGRRSARVSVEAKGEGGAYYHVTLHVDHAGGKKAIIVDGWPAKTARADIDAAIAALKQARKQIE